MQNAIARAGSLPASAEEYATAGVQTGMAKSSRALMFGFACGIILALSPPASADAIFRFTQTGSTPSGAVTGASGVLALTDAAFAAGVSIGRGFPNNGPAPPLNGDSLVGTGITELTFSVPVQSITLTASLAQFVPYPIGAGFFWGVALTSGPGGIPTGYIRFNDSESDFTFNLNGELSFGSFNSDQGGVCGTTGVCQFSGTFQQSVPEPASLGLFAFALASLSLGRRARRPSAAGLPQT